MSEESIRERQETFKRIREQANGDMCEVIKNCNIISRNLGLGKCEIPNIIIAYNNKIIELEKEFNKAGIDFYDRTQCESRFIIENILQALILTAKSYIDKYIAATSVSESQVQEFMDSWKKPSTFDKIFKGSKFEPKRSILTPEQIKTSRECIANYIKCYDKMYDFTIQNNIVEAILFYRVLAMARGVSDFDSRIDTIDMELRKLGYSSVKNTITQQIDEQELTLANILNLKSVSIGKVQE